MNKVIDSVATGRRLKELCEQKGLSPHDIRDLMDLNDERIVYYWFSGRYLPSLSNLYLLSQLLDCTINSLLVPSEKSGRCMRKDEENKG